MDVTVGKLTFSSKPKNETFIFVHRSLLLYGLLIGRVLFIRSVNSGGDSVEE